MSRTAWRCLLGGLLAVAGWPGGRAAISYTNTMAQMTSHITNQMAVGNIQGLSIALVDDQAVVWSRGFGLADRERGIAADADTVYHVGSVSKAFLGTAYMQLRDQGRVNLEAPLTNYIPEFSLRERFSDAGTVTIRSLLNHHSGIPGDFFNGMITTREIPHYAPWLVNCLQADYPFMPVNQRYTYCNSGFMLLSEVIARITGVDFAAALDTMLLAPIGMASSSFRPDKCAISNRLAAAYTAEGRRRPPEILNALGSGSLYSSVNDQARFIRLLLADGLWQGGRIVSSNGIDVMTAPQLTNLPLNVADTPQGLGWDNVSDARFRYAGKIFWKDGGTWFHCAYLGMSCELKLGVAVIQNTPGSQCDEIGAEALRWAILEKFPGKHWPTNEFVPTPSPVTNRPPAELEALAGLYVGGEGYHQIEAGAGSLTLKVNAHQDAPLALSNLVPRANGWFSPADSQFRQLVFTNLAGHDMLVLRSASGAFESVEPLGEHYLPTALPPAWAARTGRVYRVVDMNPVEYFWGVGQELAKTLRFKVQDGALLTEWMLGQYVLQPAADTLAFQRGTHYRKGGAVQVGLTNGFELLNYSSYHFLDEAAIPILPVPAVTNGAIPFAGGTQWYWFRGQSGQTYRARVAAPGREVFLRITDREGVALAEASNGLAELACVANGAFALAVSATNVFAYRLSLLPAGAAPVAADYDGDGRADPAVYAAATGDWQVRLSGSGYGLESLAGCGGPDAAAALGDFDGDGLTDPASYCAATARWRACFSGSGYSATGLDNFGGAGWEPAPGDYDGDRRTDPAIFNPAAGQWQAAFSSRGHATVAISGLGGPGCRPASGDYDGDGHTDPAVYDPAIGSLTVLLSAGSQLTAVFASLGGPGWTPLPGDYDGDGRADPAIYRADTASWRVRLSGSGYGLAALDDFGGVVGSVTAADFDGDRRADPALLDETTGIWHVRLSGTGYAEATLLSGWTP